MARERGFGSLLLAFALLWAGAAVFMDDGVVGTTAADLLEERASAVEKNGNWTVTGTEYYNSTLVELKGNLSVHGSLILDGSDLRLNGSANFIPGISVHDGGTLVVRNGSKISHAVGLRYFFILNATSKVRFNGSVIEDCGLGGPEPRLSGIYTESMDMRINNCRIRNGSSGLVASGAHVRLQGTNITNMDSWGVALYDDTNINSTLVNISECQRAGILLVNSTAELRNWNFLNVFTSIDATLSSVNASYCNLFGLSPVSGRFNSSRVGLMDCASTFQGGSILEVTRPVGGSTSLHLLNSTFDEIMVEDPGADVSSSVRYDIIVRTNYNPPAREADIDIRDVKGDLVFHGLADSNGRIEDLPITVSEYDMSGPTLMTPHNVSVMYEGGYRSEEFMATQGHSVTVEVILNDPKVFIDYPKKGSWVPHREFFLNGHIEDERPITDIWISIDGSPELNVPPAKEFSIPLNLADGEHTARVAAMNDDGKLSASQVDFGIDTIYPELRITSPVDGVYTNKSNILIKGTCSSDSHLYLDQDLVPVINGSFTASCLLKEGENEIKLKAVDRAQNTIVKNITVHRDSVPPNLIILSPLNGTRTNEDLILIIGSVNDDARTVFINGETITVENGEFQHSVLILNEGSNRIRITAEDITGTRTTRVLRIIKDTIPPDLAVTEAPVLTNENMVTIRGTVDPGSTLMVNNQPIIPAGGTFSAEIELLEGENIIEVWAIDDVGNEKTVLKTITLDTQAPVLDRLEPPSGTSVTNPILQIEGEVYDNVGIRSVRGKVNEEGFQQISTKETWTWILTLSEGENILDLEIEDSAGNILFRQFTYTLTISEAGDVEPPTIVISTPSSNESLKAGKIEVQGWAMDDTELRRVEIRLDDGEWITVDGLQNWEIELDLVKGIYIIEARATDTSGNVGTDSIWVSVYIEEMDKNGEEETTKWPLFFGLGLFVLVISGLIIYMLFIRISYQRELEERTSREEKDNSNKENGRRRIRSSDEKGASKKHRPGRGR